MIRIASLAAVGILAGLVATQIFTGFADDGPELPDNPDSGFSDEERYGVGSYFLDTSPLGVPAANPERERLSKLSAAELVEEVRALTAASP